MRNKTIKFAAIALLSAFALTACNDEVIAKPEGYDDNSPVVSFASDDKIYNNNFKDIYDSIRDGSLASDVLDQLLYQYSVSVFGNYNKVTAAKITNNGFGEDTLKAAVADLTKNGDTITGGGEVAKRFINDHEAYWTKNKDGKRIKDDLTENTTNEVSQSEFARLGKKWETIEQRISKKLYAAISGGAYSDRNVFQEERYLRSLANSLENHVKDLDEADLFEGVLTNAVEDFDVLDDVKGQTEDINGNLDNILHRDNYQGNGRLNQQETADEKVTYIEDQLIPDIYRQLLVEQYVLDESYDTLGRTSARHISVLSISKSNDYSKGAINLMNEFVNNTIFNKDRTDDITLDDFKVVSNAWVGAFMSDADYTQSPEWALMDAANHEYLNEDDPNAKYFQGTAYGDMMEEIAKINDNPAISENETKYTADNSYTVETGKEIKTRELQLQDYTSTGWYVKSEGVSGLPDSLKNQLFDINVANALTTDKDNVVKYSYDTTANAWTTNEVDAETGKIRTDLINVVGEVNGQFFLRNTTRIKGNPVESDLLFEADGKYYVVLVEDAIRSTNLNKGNYTPEKIKDATERTEALNKLETYINEIVQIVAENDTYKTLSKKHWIEEMNLKYHDQVVYDYFKTNFPDLFED